MKVKLHHTHIFASDMDRTLKFWQGMFGAEILFDMQIAGARNVMIDVGSGKLNIYDQPPNEGRGGSVHHLGIQTDNLLGLIDHMQNQGFCFISKIRDFEAGRYIMAMAPDDILLELFEYFTEGSPEKVQRAFGI